MHPVAGRPAKGQYQKAMEKVECPRCLAMPGYSCTSTSSVVHEARRSMAIGAGHWDPEEAFDRSLKGGLYGEPLEALKPR